MKPACNTLISEFTNKQIWIHVHLYRGEDITWVATISMHGINSVVIVSWIATTHTARKFTDIICGLRDSANICACSRQSVYQQIGYFRRCVCTLIPADYMIENLEMVDADNSTNGRRRRKDDRAKQQKLRKRLHWSTAAATAVWSPDVEEDALPRLQLWLDQSERTEDQLRNTPLKLCGEIN
jgi:hypothetical protein